MALLLTTSALFMKPGARFEETNLEDLDSGGETYRIIETAELRWWGGNT